MELITRQFKSYEGANKVATDVAPAYQGLADSKFWIKIDENRYEAINAYEYLREIKL